MIENSEIKPSFFIGPIPSLLEKRPRFFFVVVVVVIIIYHNIQAE